LGRLIILGWLKDVEHDLRELKVKEWKQKANNREEFVVKKPVL
jgi:hypothetical protein